MNFDERAAARRRAKKLKYDLKELRKEMLSAGGDKPQTGNDLKELQEVLQLGRTLRMDYAKARTHLSRGRESIVKLLECMAESPVDEVRTSLDALVVDLESVYHDCSIREDDLDYQSTIQSLKQMVEQYAENAKDAKTEAGRAFASIMLRSELENIKAVLDDAQVGRSRTSSRWRIMFCTETGRLWGKWRMSSGMCMYSLTSTMPLWQAF